MEAAQGFASIRPDGGKNATKADPAGRCRRQPQPSAPLRAGQQRHPATMTISAWWWHATKRGLTRHSVCCRTSVILDHRHQPLSGNIRLGVLDSFRVLPERYDE